MTTKELLDNLKNSKKYGSFTYFEKSVLFKDQFKDKDYDLVQVQDMTPLDEENILGFAGTFKWENNTIISLDGDSYRKFMSIWGYEEFENKGKKCLDILTEDW